MRPPKTSLAFIYLIAISLGTSCISKREFPVQKFYNYDADLPLEDSVTLVSDSADFQLFKFSYTSVHQKRVPGLLSVPSKSKEPPPVIILLHGLGDRKTVDYIEAGDQYFLKAGYAALRIDIDNHGERKVDDYDFSLTDGYRYWTRDIMTQTVFDLRRSIDFLEQRNDVDAGRIGFFGISLGGIIGTIFCGVDDRVDVPVIALAGGDLSLMFGLDALTDDTKDFFSIIEPINFVEMIAPRPLLMINAEHDEVILPFTTKLLFNEANHPKDIIWYPSKHRDLPIDEAYPAGIQWFTKYL